MNQAVASWNRHEQKPKYDGPDSILVDGNKQFLPVEDSVMEADSRVGINQHAVVALALYGTQDRVENLYRQTKPAVKRLRVRMRGVEPFVVPPDGQGSHPNLHDVIRWLDQLNRERRFRSERRFLKRLHKTVEGRVRPEVKTEVDAPQGLH